MAENPESSAKPSVADLTPNSTRVSRRIFGYRAGAALLSAFGLSATSEAKQAKAQSAQIPKPFDKDAPVLTDFAPSSVAPKTDNSILRDAARGGNLDAETSANLVVFEKEVRDLTDSVHKALPVNSQRIDINYHPRALDNMSFPIVSPSDLLNPGVEIYTQNNDKATLDASFLLTGDAIGHVLDQVYAGRMSREAGWVYHDIMNAANDKEKDAVLKLSLIHI